MRDLVIVPILFMGLLCRANEDFDRWSQSFQAGERQLAARETIADGIRIVQTLKLPANTPVTYLGSGEVAGVYQFEKYSVGSLSCELRTLGMPGIPRLFCTDDQTGATYHSQYLNGDPGQTQRSRKTAKRRKPI